MKYMRFDGAEGEKPSEDWQRAGLMSRDSVSVDWFEKPPVHRSGEHSHENEQVFVIIEGTLVLHTERESAALKPYNAA